RVREGASLGTGLAQEHGLFSGVTVGLVRAGERGVGLDRALQQAAFQLEREAETVAKLRAALAYPMLLAVVGTISAGVIMLFVMPRFVALLSDLGQALPVATRILIGVSATARRFGLVIGAGEDRRRRRAPRAATSQSCGARGARSGAATQDAGDVRRAGPDPRVRGARGVRGCGIVAGRLLSEAGMSDQAITNPGRKPGES